jgi:alkanesulfonate monooxygenase SsuD/methylene tetrahydromethanopterin reductase-like flavin-dependent oxidoreductase (luciferase family)
MCDEHTHASHVLPRLSAAADAAGRATPRVIAGLPVAVCDDVVSGKEIAEQRFGMYRHMPNYARMLELGESGSPSEVAVIGNEEQVTERLASYEASGVTDLAAMTFAVGGDRSERAENAERTKQLLAKLARDARAQSLG